MNNTIVIRVVFLSAFLIASFLSPHKALAVSVSITAYPSTIAQDMFTITASISGAGNGTNYLRIDLYKDETQNYFGETNNGSGWYSGSDYHQYFPVTISNSFWSGTIHGNFGNPTVSQYDGTGTYRMRLRRYTSGGSITTSEADASSVVIAVVVPSPTPSSVPTSSPISTSAPTATKSPATPTTKNPSAPTTSTPTLFTISSSSAQTSQSGVLGSSVSSYPTRVESAKDRKQTSLNFFSLLFILGGISILGSCGILFFRIRKTQTSNAITHTTDE